MSYACVICGERYRGKRGTTTTFHRFPKNDLRRQDWLKSIRKKIKNFNPSFHGRICSQHFVNDSFKLPIDRRGHTLKPTAIPTVFHVIRSELKVCSESDIDDDLHETEANPTTVSPTVTTIEFTNDDEIHNMDADCKTISTSKITVSQTETQHLSKETRGIVSMDKEYSQNCNKLRKQLQEANALNAILQQKLTLLQQKNKRFEKCIQHLLAFLQKNEVLSQNLINFYKGTKCYQKMLVRYSNKIITDASDTL